MPSASTRDGQSFGRISSRDRNPRNGIAIAITTTTIIHTAKSRRVGAAERETVVRIRSYRPIASDDRAKSADQAPNPIALPRS